MNIGDRYAEPSIAPSWMLHSLDSDAARVANSPIIASMTKVKMLVQPQVRGAGES